MSVSNSSPERLRLMQPEAKQKQALKAAKDFVADANVLASIKKQYTYLWITEKYYIENFGT